MDAMREFGRGAGAVARIVGAIALPISEAVLANRHGDHDRALDLMKPILDEMHRLGGSHAQQDVLEQLFLDSAIKANRAPKLGRICPRRTAISAPKQLERWDSVGLHSRAISTPPTC